MQIRILLLALALGLGAISTQAQVKKKMSFYELDIIKGLFFQPNTVAPWTGLAFEDHPNGKRQMEVQIKDGKIHGKVKEWERNGKKVYQAEYENGVQVGTEEQWYADGFNKVLVTYQNGLPHGTCTEWHQTGGKKSLGEFVNGKEEGEHNWWYPTGKQDQTVNYKNGKEDGMMKAWHENGKLKIDATYKMGKLVGDYALWYSNGQQKAQKTFRDSLHIGEALFWGTDGRLTGKKVYDDAGKLLHDYNYNSGSVKAGEKHYVQVFNAKSSYYKIDLRAEDRIFYIDDAEDITYSMDGMLLQCFAYPNGKMSESVDMQTAFDRFLAKEKKYIEENTDSEIEIVQTKKTTAQGVPYYYWNFVSPSSKDEEQKARTVQSEHYYTFFCNDQILNLYSVVTNSDEPVKVLGMLSKIADTFTCEEKPIDLNALK